MKVLVACEESQTVCLAFRERGHEAYSCDIIDCSGGHPEWHIKDDAIKTAYSGGWDLMIAHPPCTYLSYAGIKWFSLDDFGFNAIERHRKMVDAMEFFYKLWIAPIEKICIENPRGFITKVLKPTQLINPYYFGDEFSKPTYLWLKNLPPLYHNKEITLFDDVITHVNKGEFVEHITKTGKIKKDAKWYYEAISLPKEERARVRSKTFEGIAKAMASQWG
jgi:hypothetical protein